MSTDNLTLADIRRELRHLVALADSSERPRPTRTNPPGHPMPGHEWTVVEHGHPYTQRIFGWIIRAVDDPEHSDAVYVSSPDCTNPGEDFTPMSTADARRLAMALLAAADRAAVLAEAADWLKAWRPEFFERWAITEQERYEGGVDDAAAELRRLAAEAPTTTKPETDTLPAWLSQRFDPSGPDWDGLSDDDRAYWEHQARAVRRAVARNGFKPSTEPAAGVGQDGAQP